MCISFRRPSELVCFKAHIFVSLRCDVPDNAVNLHSRLTGLQVPFNHTFKCMEVGGKCSYRRIMTGLYCPSASSGHAISFPQHFLFIQHGMSHLISTKHPQVICDFYLTARNFKSYQTLRRGVYRILVGKPERTRPLGRPRCRWKNNTKMDIQDVGCGGMN
jgi:hypothetical protein